MMRPISSPATNTGVGDIVSRFLHDNYDEIEREFERLSEDAANDSESFGDPMPNNDELWQRAYDSIVEESFPMMGWRG